jgi:hypothetical protein
MPDRPMLARNSSGVILLRDDMDGREAEKEIWRRKPGNSWA